MARNFFVGLLIAALTISSLLNSGREVWVNHNREVARNATFALYHDKNFLCTATAYQHKGDAYKLVTAGHCALVEDDGKYYVQPEILIGEERFPVKILKHKRDYSTHIDYMVLEMDTKEKFPTVKIGSSKDVYIGDPLFLVHFSLGITKQQSFGNVATNIMDEASVDEDTGSCGLCVNRFMGTVFATHGASGAAVIDERTGKVVGLLVGGVDGETLGGFIEPIDLIKSEL
jgi:hypothetical protein